MIGPGAILFFATSLAFHSAATPAAVITLMIGIGVGASLISTPASVHVAEISPAAHRGEALGGVLILTTCGHSAIYGFVPLYALDHGQGILLSWFFGVYAVWMFTCRALLRGVSDRVGRTQVLVPAMVMLCAGAWDVGIVIGSAVVGFVVERAGFGPGLMVGAATAAAGLLVFVTGERRRAAAGPYGR